jgi:sigma-B regulation protein RsbU (phosphoserine phosphatase)
MQREQALALVRHLMDAVAARDIPRLLECYASDAVAASPVFGEVKGRDAIADTWRRLFATFPDIGVGIGEVLVDGDRIAMLSSISTTDRAGWFGLPPTGAPINYRIVVLLTIANGLIVRDERLYDSTGVLERLEKARIDKELRTAADVQRALLARTAHRTAYSESVGSSVPCRAIGGDFFEFVDLPGGAVGVAMGDVSGKGPAAALLAAMVQGMFVVEAPAAGGPGRTLSRLNRRLVERRVDARYATLVYAVLSPDGGLAYAIAGHNPPALVSRGGVRRLTVGGPLLGVFEEAQFEEQALRVADGDSLVMFTDGVTEARNAADEEYGEERLLACLTSHAGAPAVELMNRVFDAVHAFSGQAEQGDDMTVAVTRFRP